MKYTNDIYVYLSDYIYIMRDNWTIDWDINNNVVTCGEADVINRPLTQGVLLSDRKLAPTICHSHWPWRPFQMDLMEW